MEFEWDEAKNARNLGERGIGFDNGARIFDGPVLIWEDKRRDYGED
ncbi:MAG TPA: BrnT family toxin [Stellaceae bacterium]|nr:BrnT family toxin [Stellaceae bacterium]